MPFSPKAKGEPINKSRGTLQKEAKDMIKVKKEATEELAFSPKRCTKALPAHPAGHYGNNLTRF